MPLISVIIPVYNHAHTIKRCLDGIFAQTYKPTEIIIVNDGSTDNFSSVIATCHPSSNCHPELVSGSLSVITQPNHGAASARNRGFAESKGDYVIFWDADTIAKPDMLEKMYKALQDHPEASYSYSQFKFGWKKIKSHAFDANLLKKLNYIDTTSLIRRSALCHPEAANCHPELVSGSPSGPFDASLHRFQDWDLFLTLLEQNKNGIFIPEVLFKKTVGTRQGISSWLPSFVYKFFNLKKVQKYNEAKQIILKKHNLIS